MSKYENNILFGDCIELMKKMKDDGVRVQTCITSPPYYGLRSYLPDNHPDKHLEIGTEKSPEEFIQKLVEVFRGVWDILEDDGTLWVNIGDSYYNYRPGAGQKQSKQSIDGQKFSEVENCNKRGLKLEGLKEKDLIGIPWLLAFALRNDGWYLRQDIIWCLSGGTNLYVKTKKSGEQIMTIKDMVRLNPKDLQLWNGSKWTNVIGWGESNDTENKIELVLRSGERIGATGNHIFPTTNGDKFVKDLLVGDKLLSCTLPDTELPKNPKYLSDDLAWFIGLYMAQGCKNQKTGITISLHSNKIHWIDRIKSIMMDLCCTFNYKINDNNLTVSCFGSVLVSIIDKYINGYTAHDKRFSNDLWLLSNIKLKCIVNGYFDGDGHYDKTSDRIRLGFCRNYYLEKDFRTLASRLSATLTLKMSTAKYQNGSKPAFRGEWRWNVSNHHNNKDRNEIVEIRKSRGRKFWDISVEDEPHLFSLSSGILTHNCKPSCMPESVKDRCTKSHEYVFLLSKNKSYYYDANAIKEPATTFDSTIRNRDIGKLNNTAGKTRSGGLTHNQYEFRNKRSVWSVNPKPYSEAHFAVFPPELIEPCVLAGSKENDIVFDPFIGSGTVAEVALKHNRKYLGCDLNSDYKPLQDKRIMLENNKPKSLF